MRIKIGPYKNWIGPYQIAEKICFWVPKEKDEYGFPRTQDWVHDFGTWLAEDKNGNDTWLTKVCQWVDSKKKRKVKIRIDKYDTWSMDHTLAMIVLPMLKKLREEKHGSAMVDLEDVPESMRLISHDEWDAQLCFDFYNDPDLQKIQCDVHDRWNWVMDEMIWTFEQILDDDWEDQYWITYPEMDFTKQPDVEGKEFVPVRWKVEGECDWEGRKKHQERIDNGLRLFGKYYQGLWD
jgi:hypothetical protein